MSAASLLRWSGLSAALGGALLALFAVLHPPRDLHAIEASLWVATHQLGVFALVFILLGLVGLYARQAGQVGWPGLAGFVLAFFGTALYMGGIFLDAYFFPLLARDAPHVVEAVLTADLSGPPLVGLGLASALTALGYFLFGAATFRAGLFPRWAAALLAVSMPVFAPGPLLPKAVQTLAAVAAGLALVRLGYALWAGSRSAAPPEPGD